MVFNTLTFVVFFAIVVVVHSLPLAWTTRKINLLIASYIFYAAWNPPFILLLMAGRSVVPAHNGQPYFVGYFGMQFLLPPKPFE